MLLVVKNPWLELILAGKKVWEIRDASTKVRGKIHLALSGGGGRIVGQCHITDSFAVDKGVLGKHVVKHCVKDLGMIPYRRPHAWVLPTCRHRHKRGHSLEQSPRCNRGIDSEVEDEGMGGGEKGGSASPLFAS